jgi:hypothetical protein
VLHLAAKYGDARGLVSHLKTALLYSALLLLVAAYLERPRNRLISHNLYDFSERGMQQQAVTEQSRAE